MLEHAPVTFAGGPTYMPDYLKQALRQKLFPGDNSTSYFQITSKHKEFAQLVNKARHNLQELLQVPFNNQIWFLGGGVHLQFASLPLNFSIFANYTTTGYFSKLSFFEAKKYCQPKSILDMSKNQKGQFYLPQHYNFAENALYTHFIDNQSVEGVEYADNFFPVVEGVPLFDDCSSSFLTKPIDWSKVDMVYAHAQKNAGTSGLTVMILNDNLLRGQANPILPQICSFQNYTSLNGYYSEMSIVPIYSHYIITRQMLSHGGVNMNNYIKRANRLYDVLQRGRIYTPKVQEEYRSRIIVTWDIKDQHVADKCIEEAAKQGLYEFKGHRTIGGFRASLFAPIPDQAAYRLADFLQQFSDKYE